jgi:hypothetical protein
MKPRTAALTAGLLAAGLALAGCGSGDPSAAPRSPTLPTGTSLNSPGATISGTGGGNIKDLPAGFPLPPGTTVGRVAVRGTDITAPMNVPDGDQAAAFWKQQLPTAGYTVGASTVSDALGAIKFTGHGCTGASQIAISGQHVAFTCFR